MVSMVKLNPELAKSTPAENAVSSSAYTRSASISSRSSLYASAGLDITADDVLDIGGDDTVPTGNHFMYIPPNPRKFYRRLLERCLLADLEVMLSPDMDDNEEVSLGILSDSHLDLLNECALRWRVGHPYRAVCFLERVKQFYERQDIPFECVPEALQHVSTVMSEIGVEDWPAQDVRAFLSFNLAASSYPDDRQIISQPSTAGCSTLWSRISTMPWTAFPI